jgi:hypothetical protein
MKHITQLSFFAPKDRTELVSDHEALKNGVVRYVGRHWDSQQSAFVPNEVPQNVNALHEYVQAAKRGELICADEATAKYCALPFQATYDPKIVIEVALDA